MTAPKGILFDFGETLLRQIKFDTDAGNARCLSLSENHGGVTEADVQRTAAYLNETIMPRRETSCLEFDVQHFQRLLYEQLDLSFRLSSEELALEFWKTSSEFEPEPGVFDVLDFLRARKIKMGVVSNFAFSRELLEWEFKKQNMLHYFEFVVPSSYYGIRKPDSLFFTVAAKKMLLPARDLWFIGDKLQYDVDGAKKVGMFSVWFNKNEEPANDIVPDLEINSWHKFLSVLKELFNDI